MSVGHYPNIVRHSTFRDFTRDLVHFEPQLCYHGCGRYPEQYGHLVCDLCQLAVHTEKPSKARGVVKRAASHRGPSIKLKGSAG